MTSSAEQFSLRWNNFHSNITSEFQSLLRGEDLVDVTLATEGKFVQAHKLVLSVCSPYFKELFKVNPCKHPIVILKDVSYKELNAILQFMYRGEVNVKQEELTSFLKTAELLQVKGLTGEDSPSSSPTHESSSKKASVLPVIEMPVIEPESPGPRPAKRSRASTLHSSPAHSIPSVQSPSSVVLPVPSKSPSINSEGSRDVEYLDVLKPKEEPIELDDDYEINMVPNIKEKDDNVIQMLGGESSQETPAGSGMFSMVGLSQDSVLSQDGGQGDFICHSSVRCPMCPRQFTYKTNMLVHLKNVHGDDKGPFPCTYCGRIYKNRNSLRVHVYLYHKENIKLSDSGLSHPQFM